MLGGDDGNETFGGNERYISTLILYQIRKKIFTPLINRFRDTGLFHKAKRYVRRATISYLARFYSCNLLEEMKSEIIFRPEIMTEINFNSLIGFARQHYKNAIPTDDTDRLLYLDTKFTITDKDRFKVIHMAEAAEIK